VLIVLFSLGVTGEALQAKIDRKTNRQLRSNVVSLTQNFTQKRTDHFSRIVRPMNALRLCRQQFSRKETF